MSFCANCQDFLSGGLNKGRPHRDGVLSIQPSSKPRCRLCALLLDKFQNETDSPNGAQLLLELQSFLRFPRIFYSYKFGEKTIGFKIVNLHRKGILSPKPSN